jgi:hypothetical protein
VDAELARAMRTRATEHIRRHLGDALPPADPTPGPARPSGEDVPVPVPLPEATVAAVRALVGAEQVPLFVAAATDREVAARRMDALTDRD